jgi:nicotinamidase-related amidase
MPSADMLEAQLAALVVVDVQEKMLAAVGTSPAERIIDRIRRLVGAAEVLDLPVIYTEQNPRGLAAARPTTRPDRSTAPAVRDRACRMLPSWPGHLP